MNLITFDALRSYRMSGLRYIKPERMRDHIDDIRAADGVLFPEYWQVNSLVYGLGAKIFPSVASYMIGHDKVEMTRCFEMVAPAHVPMTLIRANTPSNAQEVWDSMDLPFVVKIPRSSMGQGVFLIETYDQFQDYLNQSPVIYAQEYLPIDRDLRIIWVGDQIIGGYWRNQAPQGFYNNVSKGGTIERGLVPLEARNLVEHLATSLGIDHGGFDIAMVGSHPFVFEFNRLFGNQGLVGAQEQIDNQIRDYLSRQWGSDDDSPNPEQPLPEAV
ncbi:hypothetical protein KUV56_09245 [Ferrimonas balearica]|uniref:ATP-grasp domain-containing protein n=1 Tax=Ferrimonas balearica TaxID=44012 RepID=UPI001C560635|nr:hypothetical protein [Ferrimonas balearica]MBW3139699.1 hypothetical protein [Ferrimonas balearica]MBY6107195.1 hypothetical protein [Ferrimonas balearica]